MKKWAGAVLGTAVLGLMTVTAYSAELDILKPRVPADHLACGPYLIELMIGKVPWTGVHSGRSRPIPFAANPMTGVTGTRSIENLFSLGDDRRRHGERGFHGFCRGDLVCRNPWFQNIELCRISCR